MRSGLLLAEKNSQAEADDIQYSSELDYNISEQRIAQSKVLWSVRAHEDNWRDQHFPNDGCVRLQAFPGRVRPTFVSEQRVNQGMAVRDEVKGLRCVDVEMLLVRLFAFSLWIDLGN